MSYSLADVGDRLLTDLRMIASWRGDSLGCKLWQKTRWVLKIYHTHHTPYHTPTGTLLCKVTSFAAVYAYDKKVIGLYNSWKRKVVKSKNVYIAGKNTEHHTHVTRMTLGLCTGKGFGGFDYRTPYHTQVVKSQFWRN